jgi:two-component system, response regulator
VAWRITSEFLKSRRVLIIVDDPEVRTLHRQMLEACGALVVEAGSVGNAFELLNRLTPHAILSDLEMPERGGLEFIRKLRASVLPAAHVPAICITSLPAEQYRARVLIAGFQAIMTKPLHREHLCEVVRQLIDRSGATTG